MALQCLYHPIYLLLFWYIALIRQWAYTFSSQFPAPKYLTNIHSKVRHHLKKLSIINQSGSHLLSIINDVLNISKIEAGRISLDIKTFDLKHSLKTITEIFSSRCGEVKILFHTDIAPRVPSHIKGDNGKLSQILFNLLGNSLKFTPDGGITLRVSVKKSEAGLSANFPPASSDTKYHAASITTNGSQILHFFIALWWPIV